MELGINDTSGAAYAAGNVTALAYVALGNLLSVTDALGNVTAVSEYDSMGRVIKTTDALGLVTDYSYDEAGKLLEVVERPTYSYNLIVVKQSRIRILQNTREEDGLGRKISINTDLNGRKVVIISDIRFKGKRKIDWATVDK